ncbi:hypothetical protein ACNPII_15070 [Klebsiella pneumoniae]|uniref:hypothetical protein n=1 Tax=Klebsiella/Raoultella group TaxID=2890311 RepID=UPI0038B08424
MYLRKTRGFHSSETVILPYPGKLPWEIPGCPELPYFLFQYQRRFYTRPARSFRRLFTVSNKGGRNGLSEQWFAKHTTTSCGKKTGGVIGATAGGLAGLEGVSTGALIGSAIPAVGTLAGGLIGFLSGAYADAVTGAIAGENWTVTYLMNMTAHIVSIPSMNHNVQRRL